MTVMASEEEFLQTLDKCTGVINEFVINNVFRGNFSYNKKRSFSFPMKLVGIS